MNEVNPQNSEKGAKMQEYINVFGEDDSVEDNWNDDGEMPPEPQTDGNS